jgi:hypothetical protein
MTVPSIRAGLRRVILLSSLAATSLIACPALAQDRQLILTNKPDDPIELASPIEWDENGNVLATPVDPQECTATGDCQGVDVALTAFAANNEQAALTIDQGDPVNFTWTSQGAWQCLTRGDFPGWGDGTTKPQSASSFEQQVATGSVPFGTYSAGLQCENGSVQSDIASVSITVEEGSTTPPTDCPSNRQPPAGWTRQVDCTQFGVDCTDLGAVFGGSGNLTEINEREQILLNRSVNTEYVALEFNTDGMSPGYTGSFDIESPQGVNYASDRKMVTISSCPGDFNQSAIANAGECFFDGAFGAPLVTIGKINFGGTASGRDCSLEADRTYYLNILYTDSLPGTDPDNIQPLDCGNNADGCGNQWSP